MALAEKEKSKLKMVILTGPSENNITWYSPVKQNKKPNHVIIKGMVRRFTDNYTAGKLGVNKVQVVQFYEDGTLIDQFKPN